MNGCDYHRKVEAMSPDGNTVKMVHVCIIYNDNCTIHYIVYTHASIIIDCIIALEALTYHCCIIHLL